jgi:hypothetical protein
MARANTRGSAFYISYSLGQTQNKTLHLRTLENSQCHNEPGSPLPMIGMKKPPTSEIEVLSVAFGRKVFEAPAWYGLGQTFFLPSHPRLVLLAVLPPQPPFPRPSLAVLCQKLANSC